MKNNLKIDLQEISKEFRLKEFRISLGNKLLILINFNRILLNNKRIFEKYFFMFISTK